MAVIALTSASGAPGVSTTALAMTLLWPRRVVLLEADVTGGSAVLAGYLRGAVSAHERSLLGLAAAHHGHLGTALFSQAIPLDDAGRRHVVPAIADPVQAPALAPLWAPLVRLLSVWDTQGVDVIVDAGRLGAAHGPTPLLDAADAVLLLTRTQLPAVAAARAHGTHLAARRGPERQDPADTDASGAAARGPTGLVLVGEGRPYTRREITAAVGLPVTAVVAWDAVAAEVLSVGAPRPRRWEESELLTSVEAAVTAVRDLLTAGRDRARPSTPVDAAPTGHRPWSPAASPDPAVAR